MGKKKKYIEDNEYYSDYGDENNDIIVSDTISAPNVLLFITSIISGWLAYILGNIFQDKYGTISYPLLFAILYIILFILVVIITILTNFLRGNINNEVFFNNYPMFFIALAILIPISFGIAMLFQYIYGLTEKVDFNETTSIIFVIDNSYSMNSTDPEDARYDAIETITEEMGEDMPFMIYQFGSDIELTRDMANINDVPYLPEKYAVGDSTEIKKALSSVLSDYKSGVWKDDKNPRVILLTDGYPTDFNRVWKIRKLLSDYKKNHISISIVGLAMADNELMNGIVESTNGVFIPIDNVGSISLAMNQAAHNVRNDKFLLGMRWSYWKNGLFCILRIVFLSLLGIIIGLATTGCCFYGKTVKLTFTVAVIKSILAAVLMEILVQNSGISPSFQWLVTWLLFSVVIAVRPKALPYVDEDYEGSTIKEEPEREATKKTRYY